MKDSLSQWIICCFMIMFLQSLSAQNNISQNKYDLNDPRNPDCPCHKLQKQAEEEYAQQQHQSIQINNSNPVQVNLKAEHNLSEIKQPAVAGKHRRKTRFLKWNAAKFRIIKKMNSVKRCRPDYSVCYKW